MAQRYPQSSVHFSDLPFVRTVSHSSLSPKEMFPLPEAPSDGGFEGEDFGSTLSLSMSLRILGSMENKGRKLGQDASRSIHVDVSHVDDEELNAERENTQ